MTHRNGYDIEIPYYIWQKQNPIKRINPNLAFDFESVDGAGFLLYNSGGEKVYDQNNFRQPSEKEPEDALTGLLTFMNSQKFQKTNNFFYNLGYDTNCLLKWLPYDKRNLIATVNEVDYNGFRIKIIPEKQLKISKIRNGKMSGTTTFYDLATFYNYKPLKKLAERTEYNKVYVSDISAIDKEKYYIDKEYHDLINERCFIDCKITIELANQFTEKINKIVGVNSYKSKASIARRYVLENIKRSLKMPDVKMIDVALKAFHAGHIETCALGEFKNINNYDLNSAYPAILAQLDETTGGYINNQEYMPETAYSFYLVEVDYYDSNLSPVWYMKNDGNYHVNGKSETWVTQSEYEFFIDNGYPIKIINAYHIRKNRFTEKPLEYLVKDLYEERRKAKDNKDEIEKVYKIILNSIWGVTMNAVNKKEIADFETDIFTTIDGKIVFFNEKFIGTNMYNPVFGAWVTAETRMRLFRDFKNHLNKIIGVNTDGIYLTSKVNLPISKKLGDYSYKNIKSFVSMGSGRYFINNGSGLNDDESRFRGIPLKPSVINGKMQENRLEKSIKVSKEKPIKLKESIRNGKYHYTTFSKFPIQNYVHRDEFNVFRKVTKEIKFLNDRRYWYDPIKSIADIYDERFYSRPFTISEIMER